jgi:hypothetical protein
MPQAATDESLAQLSYLEATKVDCPGGRLSELDVVGAGGERLGRIAGVVIEAAARRVRYLDVQSAGWGRRHYLVDAEHLAQVDPQQKVLRLLATDVAEVRDLDRSAFHRFSDDDLLAAVFSTRAV